MFFKKTKRKIISIDEIINEECTKKIKAHWENLVDISKVKIDPNKKQVIIFYDNTLDEILITDTIEKLGYKVTGIKEK